MEDSSQFIGERITVEVASVGHPLRFTWRGRTYMIRSIEASRQQLDFRRDWYRRRHRDYYQVLVDTGQRFVLYHHRIPGKPYWVLLRELNNDIGYE